MNEKRENWQLSDADDFKINIQADRGTGQITHICISIEIEIRDRNRS